MYVHNRVTRPTCIFNEFSIFLMCSSFKYIRRRGGLMVSALDPGSTPDRPVRVQALAGDIGLYS